MTTHNETEARPGAGGGAVDILEEVRHAYEQAAQVAEGEVLVPVPSPGTTLRAFGGTLANEIAHLIRVRSVAHVGALRGSLRALAAPPAVAPAREADAAMLAALAALADRCEGWGRGDLAARLRALASPAAPAPCEYCAQMRREGWPESDIADVHRDLCAAGAGAAVPDGVVGRLIEARTREDR